MNEFSDGYKDLAWIFLERTTVDYCVNIHVQTLESDFPILPVFLLLIFAEVNLNWLYDNRRPESSMAIFQRFLSVPANSSPSPDSWRERNGENWRERVDIIFDVLVYPFRNIINSRIRSSRSHESLLTSSVTMHSIDLTSQDIDVKPLHNSVLGKEHCFQVATSHGSKYISCRTSEERQKWLGR